MRISDWSSDVCSSDLRRQGIQVNRANAAFLMVVALHSPNGAQNTLDLGNFATSRVIDELRRVNGVGDVQLFGSEYAMRIWLDPAKLVAYNLDRKSTRLNSSH